MSSRSPETSYRLFGALCLLMFTKNSVIWSLWMGIAHLMQITHAQTHVSISCQVYSRGISPHIYIFYQSVLLLLHAGKNQESVSFVIRVQQRIKLDLLHSVNKNRPTSTPYSSKTKGGGGGGGGCHPHKCCLNEAPMLLLWCTDPSPKSQVRRPLRCRATGAMLKVTLFWCRL